MLLTTEKLYVVTTAKKGIPSLEPAYDASQQAWIVAWQYTDLCEAKHLDPLTKGKFPVEVLVRGKDAAANEKQFINIVDTIKSAGVSKPINPLHQVLFSIC